MRQLSVALPVFNEEQTLESTLDEILKTLETLDLTWEVWVIDDGSTDQSPEIIRDFQKREPRVHCHRHKKNLGPGGFERSLQSIPRFDWVFMIAGDGQANPGDLIRFIDLATKTDAKLICGYRTKRKDGLLRGTLSFAFRSSMLMLFGVFARDPGWIRMLHRPSLQHLELQSQSAFINAERIIRAHQSGVPIAEVPTEHRERSAGRSQGGRLDWIFRSIRDLMILRLQMLRERPTKQKEKHRRGL